MGPANLTDSNILRTPEYVLLHIRAQNAGLLLTGRRQDILVEAFELLAPNGDVMSCQGRLIRQFPDCAAAVDRAVLLDCSFLAEFVNVLCRLELQTSPLARPKTKKAGHEFDEERDTASPFLVTDMLIGTLVGLGRSVEPRRISKRSKEQVTWNNARLPFHRSPTWLLLRVALRLVLDRPIYKALTAFHHGRLLEQACLLGFKGELTFTMAAKVARRMSKLNPQETLPWMQKTVDAIKASHADLDRRWQQVQKNQATGQASLLKQLCFQQDTDLGLPELKQHLSWIQQRSMDNPDATGPGDTTLFSMFPAGNFPSLSTASNLSRFCLLELESWIEANLSSWVEHRLQRNGNDMNMAK